MLLYQITYSVNEFEGHHSTGSKMKKKITKKQNISLISFYEGKRQQFKGNQGNNDLCAEMPHILREILNI